jgi:outer membrane protein OmpA-like peptidoglycan-associated protein
MKKLAHILIGGALAGGCLGPSFPGMAEDQAGTPDLGALQQSLAAEQKRIEELAQLAERAAADEQQLGNLQRKNQQLRDELAKLHEQVQVAEGRANNAEAERDQLRGELGKLRELAAAAAEDASRNLVTVVSRIKDLNAVAETQLAAGQTEPAAPPQQPAPPVVAPPSQPAKKPTHVAKTAAPAVAPAPKAQPEQEVKTAAIEAEHTDQRAVLGGRPAALSFGNLPTEKRQQIRTLLAVLHASMDERGLVTTVPADALFAPGSDQLQPDPRGTLSKVGQLLKLYGNRKVMIIGHTDGFGAATYNQHLSERQAAAVRQFLIDHSGAIPTLLTAEGMGDSRPVASKAEGRNATRRVEVVILN